MVSRERGRCIFDEVAALYDEARPHYPSELIEDVLSLSGIQPGARILEIGCGTGQATAAFAQRGYSMLCLEPGPSLAAIARERFHEYPNVQIKVTSLEDWTPEENAFDLVIAADCWRWIAPEVGYSRSARALKDSGALAIFRNTSPRVESEFRQQLDDAYRKYAPALAGGAPRDPRRDPGEERREEITRTELFENVIVRSYPWSAQYDADRYVKLLDTYSGHRSLPDGTRRSLLQAVRTLVERHGGIVTKPYLAVLHLGKKRRGQGLSTPAA